MQYFSFLTEKVPLNGSRWTINPNTDKIRICGVITGENFQTKFYTDSGQISSNNWILNQPNIRRLIIDSKYGESLHIQAINAGDYATGLNFTIITITKEEDALFKNKQRIWTQTNQNEEPTNGTGFFIFPYTNTNKFPIYLINVRFIRPLYKTANLKIGNNEIGNIIPGYTITNNENYILPIHRWLYPNEQIYTTEPLYDLGTANVYDGIIYISDKEYKDDIINFTNNNIPNSYTTMPEMPKTIFNKTTIPPAQATPINTNIPPYPIQIGTKTNLIPTGPKAVNIETTNRYNKTGAYGSKLITLPEENRTVEGIISPFGILRKSADAMGRLRTTESGIQYKSGELSVTDTNAYTLYTGYGSKNIELYAKEEAWTIQILTLYDWLSGKTITDMNTIYIAAGQSISSNIEAREIQVTCPTGTSTITGILDWEVTT